jgi:hypothetical protein
MYLAIIDPPNGPRQFIPGRTVFAISLAADIEKVTGSCPPCGDDKDAEVSDDEEESD